MDKETFDATVINMNNDDTRKKVHMLQCRGALKMQARTGLRHSGGSVLKMVRNLYGVKSRTAQGAVEELEQQLRDLGHVFVTKQQ